MGEGEKESADQGSRLRAESRYVAFNCVTQLFKEKSIRAKVAASENWAGCVSEALALILCKDILFVTLVTDFALTRRTAKWPQCGAAVQFEEPLTAVSPSPIRCRACCLASNDLLPPLSLTVSTNLGTAEFRGSRHWLNALMSSSTCQSKTGAASMLDGRG